MTDEGLGGMERGKVKGSDWGRFNDDDDDVASGV